LPLLETAYFIPFVAAAFPESTDLGCPNSRKWSLSIRKISVPKMIKF